VAQTVLVTGAEAKPFGNAHPQIVPYRPFHASDGEFIVAAGTDRQFARLCSIVGRDAWAEDPSFRTNAGRVENREAIERGFEESFRARPRAHWIAACRGAGVPAGPVRGPLEALRSAAAGSLGAVVAAAGVQFVASPIRVEGQTVPLRFPPKLDENGEALRREFGLPRGRLDL
jgi:glutaryl-CoA transferase